MHALQETLAHNLDGVRARIAAAAQRGLRSAAEVTLVAVTKQVGVEVAQALVALGVSDLGENRPQELARKAAAVRGTVRWHLIGHLQRNKVRHTLPLAHMLHSADSLRLLDTLDAEAAQLGLRPRVLVQVNASREASKFGFDPDAMIDLWPEVLQRTHLQVDGLMTMAALSPAGEHARATFRLLRELRDRLQKQSSLELPHLSMGMTNDFELAVEEGATLVRIGSALFQGLSPGLWPGS